MTEHSYPRQYLYRRIVQSKLFIDTNFDKPIDLRSISGQACFSTYHFIRLFKSVYGTTPHQYLSHVRIGKAKELLRSGISVTQVCFSVGFDGLGSFTALFKKVVGQTPSAYQLQQRRRAIEVSDEPSRFIPGCFAGGNTSVEKSNFQEAI